VPDTTPLLRLIALVILLVVTVAPRVAVLCVLPVLLQACGAGQSGLVYQMMHKVVVQVHM
jgi:hypothetical protein